MKLSFSTRSIALTSLLISGLALSLLGVGGAFGGSSQISGCINKKTFVLRVVSKCTKDETKISWNVVGPQGVQGAVGATGPDGAVGATGPKGETGSIPTLRTRQVSFVIWESWRNTGPEPIWQQNMEIPVTSFTSSQCPGGTLYHLGIADWSNQAGFSRTAFNCIISVYTP